MINLDLAHFVMSPHVFHAFKGKLKPTSSRSKLVGVTVNEFVPAAAQTASLRSKFVRVSSESMMEI